MTLTKVARH